jgi:inositol polyphosphate-4-phosphatase
LLQQLQSRVNAARQTDKRDVGVLTAAAQLCRALGAARIVSCKSAKDRTSMATTWDGLRALMQQGLPVAAARAVLERTRTFGVRRGNVIKNTGKKKYAFNGLQRSMLPDIFTPPTSTCSGKTES